MCRPRPDYCLTEYGKEQVQKNIRLAYALANKYRPPYGWDQEDWTAECLEVLCLAVARFSPARNRCLSTLADKLVWLRRGNINSASRSIRSGWKSTTVSINAPRGTSEGPSLGDLVSYTDSGFQRVERADLVSVVLGECSARGVKILTKIADDKSLPEISESLGFTRQWATQALFDERLKLIQRFPEEVKGSGACKECGGVLIIHSNKCKPIYCVPCSFQVARLKQREAAARKQRRKANAS